MPDASMASRIKSRDLQVIMDGVTAGFTGFCFRIAEQDLMKIGWFHPVISTGMKTIPKMMYIITL
jgi:hypothetical protein